MSKRKIHFVVNQRLTYISTQFLLEWTGIIPNGVLYCSYYNVENKLDEFLMEYVDFGDLVFLIGFTGDLSKELSKIYDKYDFKVMESDTDGDNIFFKTLKTLYSKLSGKLSKKQTYYISCVKDLIKNEFKNKDAYIMGIIFYKISPKLFYNHYCGGYNTSNKYNTFVLKHLKLFNKQDHTVYTYNGYYFVLSTVKYMNDFIYKYHKDYDNLCVVDLDGGRVYMKNLKSEGKDINNLCKSYCSNIRGFTDFCSGDITEDFLKLTKKMKIVDD
jgi:hypothetical protein